MQHALLAYPDVFSSNCLQVYQMVRRHIETHPDLDHLPVTWVSEAGAGAAAAQAVRV